MSLKKERANQYFSFRIGKMKNVRENDGKNQQNVELQNAPKMRVRKKPDYQWMKRVFKGMKMILTRVILLGRRRRNKTTICKKAYNNFF